MPTYHVVVYGDTECTQKIFDRKVDHAKMTDWDGTGLPELLVTYDGKTETIKCPWSVAITNGKLETPSFSIEAFPKGSL